MRSFVEPSRVSLTVSSLSVRLSSDNRLWLDSLFYPVYVAGLSAVILLCQFAADASGGVKAHNRVVTGPSSASFLQRRIRSVGGKLALAFRTVQLLATLALFGISVIQALSPSWSEHALDALTTRYAQIALYMYLSVLALVAVFGSERMHAPAFGHLSWSLASVWAVYVYRDLWPLGTTDLTPADASEGVVLWVKLSLLSIAGGFVPLFIPRKYTPVNPQEDLEPNPAQTASIWSLVTYAFMDRTVWRAYRIPHLPFDMFPPLADYDHLRNIVTHTFHFVDPFISKFRRPFILRLLRAFWVEMFQLSLVSVVLVFGALATPVSINNLLTSLEHRGNEGAIEPWIWIVLLFSGSFIKTISDQYIYFVQSRVTIRMQAMVTELIFEHALRIRMKAEISETPDASESNVSTAVPTPDNRSEVNDHDGAETSSHIATASSVTAVSSGQVVKGKGKAPRSTEDVVKSANVVPEKKGSSNLVGRLNNLVSTDLSNLEYLTLEAVTIAVRAPLEIALCIAFLYHILGWSAWIAPITMIATFPIAAYVTKIFQVTEREKMKQTDARVQFVTEVMNVIRMIKFFGWEPRMNAQMNEKRKQELHAVRKREFLNLSINMVNFSIPVVIMLGTFFTYTVIMGGSLTAAKVFSTMSVINMLQQDIDWVFYMIPRLAQANIACERIQDFLENTELLDTFDRSRGEDVEEIFTDEVAEVPQEIGIRHASFTWANDSVVLSMSTNRRMFVLNIEDEVIFHRGKINIIVGPTGAGKTSLLMALLGEMHYIPAEPDSFVNLPREDGVAYAAQESWVQNDTIRGNIVFGAPFDDGRYQKVLEQCALQRDLELFDAGDMTEVGEKGITLSGGQKARITLARAVYSSAAILLLDDILAALDVHTAKWVVDKCLTGDLLQGRTIILVTHNVAMLSPVAGFVIDLSSDGRILSQGSLSTALARDTKLLQDIQTEQEALEKVEQEMEPEKPANIEVPATVGKLIAAEELDEGHVGWKAILLYMGNVSSRPVLFWSIYWSGQVVLQIFHTMQNWYLGYWATQYETHAPDDVAIERYFTVVILLSLGLIVSATLCTSWYIFGSIRASRIIHEKLIASILKTTLRWLDKTPTSRIIARCTGDIQTVDVRIAQSASQLARTVIFLVFKMGAVVVFSPAFVIPALVVAVVGGWCANIYMKAQLSVKRELSNARAPVLGHFGAAIAGITSIRAYGAQDAFKAEAYSRIDRYSRAATTFQDLNRWVTVRIDTIGNIFTTCLAAYLTYFSDLNASNTGFSLTMAAAFSDGILYCVRTFNEFEVEGNSLERIQQYLLIEHEPEPTRDGVPPAYWPASGSLEVSNLSAKYSPEGPKVLHEVSFTVASGERVGVVGRTGSGKSSLTQALLRCILTEGSVRYDGLDTEKLNLDALRSNITIIPQVPELLSGTLRQNLDPFSEHDDAVLNDALRSAGLFSLQEEGDGLRITLDSQIAGGGTNLSVGQRQILALARAIVRRSKLLILDEATSAIDYKTDSIIQTSLRTELGKDVTILTVAHRLQTIMDADKIMVLDAGRIAEFGRPSDLLKKSDGLLRALVDESSDMEKLYAMAATACASS